MGNQFYNVLGNTAGSLTNTGPFSNLLTYIYWSATEDALDADKAWYFDMGSGDQDTNEKINFTLAWAVQSGDVGAVPIPPALWLFGTGLLGLIGMARHNKAV